MHAAETRVAFRLDSFLAKKRGHVNYPESLAGINWPGLECLPSNRPCLPTSAEWPTIARAMLTAMLTIDTRRRVLVSAERGLALIAAARSATVEVSDGLMPRVFKCPGALSIHPLWSW